MSTLKLDTNGDLAIENNSLVILSDFVAATAQRLSIKFQMFLGEWALEPRAGMPYYEQILVKNPNIPQLRTLFREVILGDTAVDVLDTLALDFDSALRQLSLNFEATLTDGSALVFTDFILGENR